MGSVIDGLEGDTVAACLGAHARRHPDRVAIDDDDGPLTYAEIDRQVDRLAAWLVHRLGDPLRTQPVMVGLLMGRARSLVTGSMAVARAGLVSVAIDPSYPDERRAAVAIDAGVAVILTDLTDLTDPGPARPVFSVPVVSLSADEIDQAPPTDPVAVDLDALSAILYTSGSTGTPKGVMMSHRTRLGVCAYVPADASQPGVRCGVIDSGSSGGAEGVQCIPLVIGGCLVPFDVASRGLDTLPAWLRDQRVNAFRGVPSVLRNLLLALGNQRLPNLTSLAVFGEQLQWIDVERLRSVIAPDGVIHNTYGSSEASVVSDFAIAPDRAPGTGPVPVGPALPGRRIVIIDDDGNPLPAGDEGAVVAVDGLMPIGYWKRPELDAELYGTLADGTRTCRTGDRGWLDDEGWLHLAGREDNVVKIAGNRVDLGEVESVLAEQGGVTAVGATT